MAEYIDREAAIKAIYESDPNGIRRALTMTLIVVFLMLWFLEKAGSE